MIRISKSVERAANVIFPELVIMPTAAVHHIVAAVLIPLTFLPSLNIIPLPRKPTPVITCAEFLTISG
mgnify:FL=1